jgi:hypothetical protein
VDTQPKGKTMKIERATKEIIRGHIGPAIACATEFERKANTASRKLYDVAEVKGFNFSAAQLAKIKKALLKGHNISISDIRTEAQVKVGDKLWEAHQKRMNVSKQKARKIINKMQELEITVRADLELCDCECEQRVIVATFLKHDLTKPWKISKCQPEVPRDL